MLRRTQCQSDPAGRCHRHLGVRAPGLRRTGRAGVRRPSRDSGHPDALGSRRGPCRAGDHPDGLLDTPAWWIGRLRADLERRTAVAPVLVSLDDLQWASPAMLAALRSLPGELKGHPIAWIFARSSARHEDAELLFSVLERDGATRITLGPLDGDAMTGLLTDAFGAPPGPDLLDLG